MVLQRQLYARLAQRSTSVLSAAVTAVMLFVWTGFYLMPELAVRLAIRELRAMDVSVARVDLVSLSPTGLVLQDLALAEGGLAVRRLTADGVLPALPDGGRLTKLRLEGVSIVGAVTDDGTLSVPGVPLTGGDRSAEQPPLASIPFDTLEIVDATLTLASPWGEAALALDADTALTLEGDLRFEGRVGGRLGPIDTVAAAVDGRVDPQGGFSVGLELARADPTIGPVAGSQVSGWAHLSGDLLGAQPILLSMQATAPHLDVAGWPLADVAVTVAGPLDAPDLAMLRFRHPQSATRLRADLLDRVDQTRLEVEIETADVQSLGHAVGTDLPLSGGARLRADLSLPAGAMTAPQTVRTGPVTGVIHLQVAEVDWPGRMAGGAMEARSEVSWRDGHLQVAGPYPWTFEIGEVAGEPVQARGEIGNGRNSGPVFAVSVADADWTAALDAVAATIEPFAWGELMLAMPGFAVSGSVAPGETALTTTGAILVDGLISPDAGVRGAEVAVSGVLLATDDELRWTATGPLIAAADRLDAYGLEVPDGLEVELVPGEGEPWLIVDDALRWRFAGTSRIIGDRLVLPDGTDLAIAWPELTLAAAGTAGSVERMIARLDGGAVTAPTWGWRFAGLQAEAELGGSDAGATDIVLTRLEARPLADPAPVVPLTLSGLIRVDDPGEGVVISGTGSAGSADGNLRMDWSARHDVVSGTGRLTATLDTLEFAADGLQPASLSPLAATFPVTLVSGTVSGTLAANWNENGEATSGDLQVSSVGFTVAGIPISGISGDLSATSLAPLVLPPGQPVSVARVELGIPMTDGEIAVGLPEDGSIAVDGAVFDWAGGTVSAESFTIPLDGSDQSFVLDANAIDLAALFDAIDLPELSATGRLDGRIPIRLGADTIRIDNGSLESTAPGVIQYVPEELSADAEAGVALLLQALRDFRYESLSMTLNGETGGETEIGLRISGANPDLYDGYPIALNVNVSGELYDILRQGLSASRYARRAEEYYRERVQDRVLEDAITGDSQ